MKKNSKRLVWILIMGLIGSIILFFSMQPNLFYQSIKNRTENTYVFDHAINHDETTYQNLGVSLMIQRIETEDFEIVGLYFYDQFVLEQIVLDLQTLGNILLEVNDSKPYTLSVIEREDDLEITIHGRFGEDWLYQKKTVQVSKYFNVLFPFIGGLSVTETSSHFAILYSWGYLEALLDHREMNYESPFVMSYQFLKSPLENPKRAYNLSHYAIDFDFPHTGEEVVLNTTQYVVIITP